MIAEQVEKKYLLLFNRVNYNLEVQALYKGVFCMKTARRTSPLSLLLALVLLLFSAWILADWTGASAYPQNGQKPLSAPVPPQSSPAPTPIPGPDKPLPAEEEGAWSLLLVNFETPLPENFSVPELTQLRRGHAVDRRAYPALQAMMDDCRAAGLSPLICSSYRSQEDQARLFDRETQGWLDRGYIGGEAESQAARWVARPGTSEHQTGLAVDIVDLSYQVLDQGQEDTAVQRWLMAHCADYGFILRYPTDKSALTGVNYEPWHYRYVGEPAAREIMDGGLCLEEYLAR